MAMPRLAAPRLDRAGYGRWADAQRFLLDMLSPARSAMQRRDIMLLASLPLPAPGAAAAPHGAEAWPLALLADPTVPGGALLDRVRIGSARLQLAYPWVETAATVLLPEAVHGAEGALAGALARTALARGAFRSAAGSALPSIRRTLPALGSAATRRGLPGKTADWLGDRLCLVGASPAGLALLSDATMSDDPAWRAGGVSRLMGILLRAARTLGQRKLFENSGPPLWAGIRGDLEQFLQRLRSAGALAGATPDEAFSVRCDRSTMTQADIDAGRVIATVAITAAQPIQRITVTLALSQGSGAAIARAA
jgi:hypothetical protein